MKKISLLILMLTSSTISFTSDFAKPILKAGGVTALTLFSVLPAAAINIGPVGAAESLKKKKPIVHTGYSPKEDWKSRLITDLGFVAAGTAATMTAVPLKCYNQDKAALACLGIAGVCVATNVVRILWQ